MGYRYTVAASFTLANASGDVDLLEILPASEKPCRLVGLKLGQISEVAEAAEENIRVAIMRLPATVTGGNGSSTTPRPVKRNNPSVGFTAEVNGATLATTSGTAQTLEEFGWNMRAAPLEMWWDEASQYNVINGEALIVRCHTTVADDVTFQITAIIEEES